MNNLIRKVGRYTYGIGVATIKNFDCQDYGVEVGAFTSIGVGLTIYLASGKGHEANSGTNYPFGILCQDVFDNYGHEPVHQTKGDVIIGNDVWIGENVTILPGVVIGDGAVIGANTVVTKYVYPYSIVTGNPGQLKKYRYDDLDLINRMTALQWWNYPDFVINKILPDLRKPLTPEIMTHLENTLDLFNSTEKDGMNVLE